MRCWQQAIPTIAVIVAAPVTATTAAPRRLDPAAAEPAADADPASTDAVRRADPSAPTPLAESDLAERGVGPPPPEPPPLTFRDR